MVYVRLIGGPHHGADLEIPDRLLTRRPQACPGFGDLRTLALPGHLVLTDGSVYLLADEYVYEYGGSWH